MKKNILHIIDTLSIGGGQIIVKEIAERANDINIHVFGLRQTKNEIDIKTPYFTRSKAKNKYSLKPLGELYAYIKKHNIQILHCHLFKSHVFGYLLKRFMFRKIALIIHEHGRVLERNTIHKTFYKFICRKTNQYLCVSQAIYDYFASIHIPEHKRMVLHNFVSGKIFDLARNGFKPHIEKRASGSFIIGFIGRLHKVKGCDVLLKAANQLNFNYQIIIAGTGNELKTYENYIHQNNLQDKVKFLGYIKDVETVYREINLLVIPSYRESFGLVALEAQAFSVPVIASDTEGLNEIIKHGANGLLFEKGNYNDLAEKINMVYFDDSLRKKIVTNSENVLQPYKVETYLSKLMNIYKSL